MDGPAGQDKLTGTRETDRAWFLFAEQCGGCSCESNQIVSEERCAEFDADHFGRLAANMTEIQ